MHVLIHYYAAIMSYFFFKYIFTVQLFISIWLIRVNWFYIKLCRHPYDLCACFFCMVGNFLVARRKYTASFLAFFLLEFSLEVPCFPVVVFLSFLLSDSNFDLTLLCIYLHNIHVTLKYHLPSIS